TVLGEAAIPALLSSLVGVALGVAIAKGLQALFSALGGSLPTAPTVLAGRTFAVAIVLGMVVTLVSALLPAVRATRVPPLAALRDDVLVPTGGRRRVRAVVGGVVAAGGVALLFAGLAGGRAAIVGLGAGLFLLG